MSYPSTGEHSLSLDEEVSHLRQRLAFLEAAQEFNNNKNFALEECRRLAGCDETCMIMETQEHNLATRDFGWQAEITHAGTSIPFRIGLRLTPDFQAATHRSVLLRLLQMIHEIMHDGA